MPSVRGRCRTRRFCLCRISGNSVFHLACHTEVPKTLASPLSSTTYTTSFPPITTLQMRRLMLRHIYVTCYLLRSLRAVVNILTDLGPFPLFFKKKIRFSASRNSVAHMNLKDSQSSLTCLRSFVNFFYRGLKDICNRYKFVINSSSQGVKDFVRWIGSILWCFPHKYFGMLLAGNPLMSNDDSGTSALPQSLISSCITAMLQPSLSIWRV